MVDTILTLDPFAFDNLEIPEAMPFGGDQRLVAHRLVGGFWLALILCALVGIFQLRVIYWGESTGREIVDAEKGDVPHHVTNLIHDVPRKKVSPFRADRSDSYVASPLDVRRGEFLGFVRPSLNHDISDVVFSGTDRPQMQAIDWLKGNGEGTFDNSRRACRQCWRGCKERLRASPHLLGRTPPGG
jgi:hypothetical protein